MPESNGGGAHDGHVLEVRDVWKSFPGVTALKSVSLTLRPGEILGLVGENGAGKSTLVKTLSGIYQPDQGEILINGHEAHFHNPKDAQRAGISTVHQELTIVPDLTVAENVMLGAFPHTALGTVRARHLCEQASKRLADLGLDIDVERLARHTTAVERQIVQIAHALTNRASVVIMDEPGAVLSPKELERLFDTLRALRRQGVAVLYISHRLQEVFDLCDRVVVLKDGQIVAARPASEMELDDMIRLMVGRDVGEIYPVRQSTPGPTVLEAVELTGEGFSGASFGARSGEILGIAGFAGCGRSELLQALFGAPRAKGGYIRVDGREVSISHPAKAIRLGIGLLTQDRKRDGLILAFPVSQNISLPGWPRIHRRGLIRGRSELAIAESYVRTLSIRPPNPSLVAGMLSGGNQQKVCIAKWLATNARVLLFDEPTRGVDVGARAEIYRLMASLVGAGKTIIVSSSDFRELAGVCDRVLVMARGEIVGELRRGEIDEETMVGMATLGRKSQA